MDSAQKDSAIRDSVLRMTLRSDHKNSTLQVDSQESEEDQKKGTNTLVTTHQQDLKESRNNRFKRGKLKTKRSSSFEKPQRTTLIQEMLQD